MIKNQKELLDVTKAIAEEYRQTYQHNFLYKDMTRGELEEMQDKCTEILQGITILLANINDTLRRY